MYYNNNQAHIRPPVGPAPRNIAASITESVRTLLFDNANHN